MLAIPKLLSRSLIPLRSLSSFLRFHIYEQSPLFACRWAERIAELAEASLPGTVGGVEVFTAEPTVGAFQDSVLHWGFAPAK